ncbi:amino acid racemase [Siccirubricoccus sp. G192]|uniref:aspartate/glutamate racemase family protein n=1 Tax=Siccirubricoccus sp. G192 TaxID=2849651 RepID=UPI0028121231|nr:amino acid racemase [Siccirubricoccus sp. G192]
MTERFLGVLGGMGPLASAQFMARLTLLTPAERDQDHIPALLWSDPRVPDRTAARLGGGEDPLPALLRGLRGLEAAGCGAIAIPCNTAHGWFDALQAATGLPILHIVDAAAAELARLGVPGERSACWAPPAPWRWASTRSGWAPAAMPAWCRSPPRWTAWSRPPSRW